MDSRFGGKELQNELLGLYQTSQQTTLRSLIIMNWISQTGIVLLAKGTNGSHSPVCITSGIHIMSSLAIKSSILCLGIRFISLQSPNCSATVQKLSIGHL